ncbi:hypothetical protein, partial [Candidatus Magnetobacterium casense]
ENAEPSAPELESHPLVVNLRQQIDTLKGMFSLATATIADKDKEIALWEKKFAAQVEISEEWKANYNREHVLRLQAEGLFKMAEHKLNVSRSWGKVKSIATVAAAGVAAYALLK